MTEGVKLTVRGAIALIFVITLVGHATGSSSIAGVAFVAGSLAAVFLVQPRDLLSLVVTPPMIFFAATLLAQLIRSLGAGSFLQALGLGMFTSLSAGAPWLFAGSVLALALAWARGLPSNVRTLRDELRAIRPTPAGPAPHAADAADGTTAQPSGTTGSTPGPAPGQRPTHSGGPAGGPAGGPTGGPTGGTGPFDPEPEGYFEPRVYGSSRDNQP